MYLMDSEVESDSMTTRIFHSSFILSLSKHLLTVDCILGIIPGTWDSSSWAARMISPDRIPYVTYSSPAPRRRAASWHLLNPGWDPKRDCHLSEVTELLQWQKQNQTSVVSKLSRAVCFSAYKPVPVSNPCCSQCRATAPRLLPRSPSSPPILISCMLSLWGQKGPSLLFLETRRKVNGGATLQRPQEFGEVF